MNMRRPPVNRLAIPSGYSVDHLCITNVAVVVDAARVSRRAYLPPSASVLCFRFQSANSPERTNIDRVRRANTVRKPNLLCATTRGGIHRILGAIAVRHTCALL